MVGSFFFLSSIGETNAHTQTHTPIPSFYDQMIACDRYFNTNRSENLPVASIMYIKSHWLFYISCCRNFLTDYILKPSIISSIYTQQCKTEFHCRINDEPFIPTNKLQKGTFFLLRNSQVMSYITGGLTDSDAFENDHAILLKTTVWLCADVSALVTNDIDQWRTQKIYKTAKKIRKNSESKITPLF